MDTIFWPRVQKTASQILSWTAGKLWNGGSEILTIWSKKLGGSKKSHETIKTRYDHFRSINREIATFYDFGDMDTFCSKTVETQLFPFWGQETPGVTGKFGLGIHNEAGQRLIEFCQENALVIANTFFQQHKRRLYTWTSPDGQNWNEIDYIHCSQDGEALYSKQKQDQELTVGQTMNSLLPNSDLNWRK